MPHCGPHKDPEFLKCWTIHNHGISNSVFAAHSHPPVARLVNWPCLEPPSDVNLPLKTGGH